MQLYLFVLSSHTNIMVMLCATSRFVLFLCRFVPLLEVGYFTFCQSRGRDCVGLEGFSKRFSCTTTFISIPFNVISTEEDKENTSSNPNFLPSSLGYTSRKTEQLPHKFVKFIGHKQLPQVNHHQQLIIMLNTKVLAATLAVFAFASAGNIQVHRKRALRRAKVVSAASNDLTEDVAFWTRSLQASFPPMPPDVG